jgi:hypothetical protein
MDLEFKPDGSYRAQSLGRQPAVQEFKVQSGLRQSYVYFISALGKP